jgi:hypothetical protein
MKAGDVIDVGLVRLSIMELAGTEVDLYSTGRIAVFSNSVLFQATAPLFKQLPGAQYTWHEVVLPLAHLLTLFGCRRRSWEPLGLLARTPDGRWAGTSPSSNMEQKLASLLRSLTNTCNLRMQDSNWRCATRWTCAMLQRWTTK